MATTTNFGWETPDDTDLVKDGAAAMRTLGNSIDTSFVDLKGGTTGQILSKASNTDLDYTWITNDVGDITAITASSPLTGGGTSGAVTVGIQDATTSVKGAVQLTDSTSSTSTTTAATPNSVKSAYDLAGAAIPKSLIDAAGDLIVGTAADTAGRVAIGTAGQVLKVNSGATGVEWAAGAGGDYVLINTYTMPGSATTYSVNNVFSSTYTNYILVGKMNSATTGALFMKLRASGTDSSASYSSMIAYWGINAGDGTTKYPNTSSGFYIENNGNNAWISAQILNPNQATQTGFLAQGVQILGDGYGRSNFGFHNVSTSYDGFTLVGSGNLSGTFSIYGLTK